MSVPLESARSSANSLKTLVGQDSTHRLSEGALGAWRPANPASYPKNQTISNACLPSLAVSTLALASASPPLAYILPGADSGEHTTHTHLCTHAHTHAHLYFTAFTVPGSSLRVMDSCGPISLLCSPAQHTRVDPAHLQSLSCLRAHFYLSTQQLS